MKLFEQIAVFLEANPSLVLSYGELGVQFQTHPKGVGSAMAALGRRGRTELCSRVIKSKV